MVDRANNVQVNGTQNKFKSDEGGSPDNDFQKMLLGDEGYKVDASRPYSEANPHVEYSGGQNGDKKDEIVSIDALSPYSEDNPNIIRSGS